MKTKHKVFVVLFCLLLVTVMFVGSKNQDDLTRWVNECNTKGGQIVHLQGTMICAKVTPL